MCRSDGQLYNSHLVVLVLPPPSYQHLSELVVLYAVALLGLVVVLLHGTVVVDRRCESQRLEVFGRRLHPAENTSPVWVWTRSPIAVVEVVVVVSPMLVIWVVVVGKWMSSSSASGWVGGMLSEQPVGVVGVTSRLPSDVVLVAVDSCVFVCSCVSVCVFVCVRAFYLYIYIFQ